MSILLALLASVTGIPEGAPAVGLRDRFIRVGDVAQAPGREDIIIASLPRGRDTVELDRSKALALLAARFPGIKFALNFFDRLQLAAPDTPSPQKTCFVAEADIADGRQVTVNDVARTVCDQRPIAPGLGYDRMLRSPVAERAIDAGEYLGAIRPAVKRLVASGEALKLRIIDGPVIVQRDVETLQVGTPGKRVFVRTRDGKVLSTRLARSMKGEAE